MDKTMALGLLVVQLIASYAAGEQMVADMGDSFEVDATSVSFDFEGKQFKLTLEIDPEAEED